MTFDTMIEALEKKKNFSLSRWGDGEFMCILGFGGSNTDKHNYYSDLGQALEDILTGEPKELLALQNLAVKDLGHIERFNELVDMNTWSANAEILSRNHARDQEFFNVLNKREVILVANRYLQPLKSSGNVGILNIPFKVNEFIEIPIRNCWREYDRILDEIKPHEDCVILCCASMMSNVLINELYSEDYTQIDVGSFLDPYVGRMTRRYHHNLEL